MPLMCVSPKIPHAPWDRFARLMIPSHTILSPLEIISIRCQMMAYLGWHDFLRICGEKRESLVSGCWTHMFWSIFTWIFWGFHDPIWLAHIWVLPKIGGVPPKSSILIGFSIINHPFWGIPIFGNTNFERNGWWVEPPTSWVERRNKSILGNQTISEIGLGLFCPYLIVRDSPGFIQFYPWFLMPERFFIVTLLCCFEQVLYNFIHLYPEGKRFPDICIYILIWINQ